MKSTITKLLFGLCLLISFAAQSEKFSIVVIPDTQWYAESNSPIFKAQTQWVVDNQVNENIIYVAHLGDLKDDLSCDNKNLGPGFTEWDYVEEALSLLEVPNIDPLVTGLPDGIPYGIVPGNHDFNQISGASVDPENPQDVCPGYKPNVIDGRPLDLFNQKLGDGRFAGREYYGGTRPADLIEIGVSPPIATGDSYTMFDHCGIEFIAINLGYRAETVGDPNALDVATVNPEISWANDLLESNPNRIGILTSHYFLNDNGGDACVVGNNCNEFGPWASAVYDELKGNPNLFMMLSGHRFGESWRTEATGRDGLQPVQAMLSNYQSIRYSSIPDYDNLIIGGPRDSGFMRIMRFDTDTGMVNVETFAPAIPSMNRPMLVSDYFPANGTGMNRDTASNFSFSFQNYGDTKFTCTDTVNLVGRPDVDRSSESGVFVWRTPNGRTMVQVVAGDPSQNGQNTDFEGNIVSGSEITALTPLGLEMTDSLTQSAMDRIDFDLIARQPWDDRFSFIADQTQSLCITLDTYVGGLFLGPDKVEVMPPYDIHGMLDCGSPPEIFGTPDIDRSSETGMFIWRNANSGRITASVAAGDPAQGGLSTPFSGLITSDQSISDLQLVSIEAADTVSLSSNNLINFEMFAISPWEDRFSFDPTTSQSVCVTLDDFADGLFVGPNKTRVNPPFDLVTLEACETLGRPMIDRSTDVGIFIWESTTNNWSSEVVSGDGARVIQVDVNSDETISNVVEVNIENSDVFTVLPSGINMSLNVTAPWLDGFKFTNQPQSNTCVSTTNVDVPIFLGPNRVNVGSSLNLDTLMSCP